MRSVWRRMHRLHRVRSAVRWRNLRGQSIGHMHRRRRFGVPDLLRFLPVGVLQGVRWGLRMHAHWHVDLPVRTNSNSPTTKPLGRRPKEPGRCPDDFGLRPNDLGRHPDDFGLRPNELGLRPNDLGLRPNDFGLHPNELGHRPDDFGLRPNELGQRPNDLGRRMKGFTP